MVGDIGYFNFFGGGRFLVCIHYIQQISGMRPSVAVMSLAKANFGHPVGYESATLILSEFKRIN